jgi:hypothetical protein
MLRSLSDARFSDTRARHARVGQVTVYRTLGILERLGHARKCRRKK